MTPEAPAHQQRTGQEEPDARQGAGSVRPAPRAWSRYVAIGDSFTEGMSDADPDTEDSFIGWADRLSALLSVHAEGFSYANLAIRGRKIGDITTRQVEAALALEPDLVSMVGGGNDILRPKADVDAIADQLEAAVTRIRSTGADVLLATPTDPVGAPVIERTRPRVGVYVAHIWTIAERHGCYVMNQWSFDFLRDWRMWAPDRIHMTEEGHRRVALAAYETLGHAPETADWRVPLPPQPKPGRIDALRDNAAWAREYAAPWVHRRLTGRSSGDHVEPKRPSLSPPPELER